MIRRSIHTLVTRANELGQHVKHLELYQRATPAVRKAGQHAVPVLALFVLFLCMGGTWHMASASPSAPIVAAPPLADGDTAHAAKKSGKELAGKLNLNTATEEQLMRLPTVGPAKAERIVAWRKKNGGFKRTADLRRVKGFGYKTFKRLEPFLDIKGDTTLE